jgi:hypothetical protein
MQEVTGSEYEATLRSLKTKLYETKTFVRLTTNKLFQTVVSIREPDG